MTQPISHRTRSRSTIVQGSNANGVLHITLRSSTRGLGGLIISIPTWDLDLDESMSSEVTVSPGSATSCDTYLEKNIIKRSDLPCDDCPICLEPFKLRQHAKRLPCEHMFHGKCIDTWLTRSKACPCCRKNVSTNMECVPLDRNVRRFTLRPRM